MSRANALLEKQFQAAAIRDVYLKILEECGLDESIFLGMVAESGALKAAKTLLKEQPVQVGFRGLRRRGRADLTVEHLAVQEPWRRLFTDQELATAKRRLMTRSKGNQHKRPCSASDCPLVPRR